MKKITLLLAAGIFLFSACELTNVLNEDPPNNLVPENVVEDAEGAEDLLNGVYASLHNQYYYIYSELNPGLLSGSMADDGFLADDEFATNNIADDNNNVENTWQVYYKTMDAANVFLDIVGEIPESEFLANRKQEMLAEARYMRAMALFDALRYFGQFWDTSSDLGVIYRTEPVDFTTRNKSRSSVQEVYNQIVEDLDAVIQTGPDLTDPYYASKTAAKALKAKVLLFMEQYADAASLADEVITDGTRNLAPTFSEVFSEGFDSEEMIFMRYTDEVTEANGERKQFTYGGSNHAIASDWLRDMMDEDPRVPASYDTTNSVILKVNNAALHYPTYFMRLAEVYLIKAEALARSGAPLADCKEPLETVRSRSSGSPYTSSATTHEELLDEIFDEIVLELAFENGSEWFAAIRFGKIMTLKPQVTSSNQYILPIPQREVEANTQLSQQNPGYN